MLRMLRMLRFAVPRPLTQSASATNPEKSANLYQNLQHVLVESALCKVGPAPKCPPRLALEPRVIKPVEAPLAKGIAPGNRFAHRLHSGRLSSC